MQCTFINLIIRVHTLYIPTDFTKKNYYAMKIMLKKFCRRKILGLLLKHLFVLVVNNYLSSNVCCPNVALWPLLEF